MKILQKIKNRTTIDQVIPLLCINLKEMKTLTQKGICIPMFSAALFTIAKKDMETTKVSINEWIKKHGYYSSIKKREVLPFITMQMHLEGVTLSEINQTDTNNKLVAARGEGDGGG